jgi:hypothetical protein
LAPSGSNFGRVKSFESGTAAARSSAPTGRQAAHHRVLISSIVDRLVEGLADADVLERVLALDVRVQQLVADWSMPRKMVRSSGPFSTCAFGSR